MASLKQTGLGSSAAPVAKKKSLKAIKTKLRLKKKDVHQCRLCMRVLRQTAMRDTMAVGSDLRQKVLDAVQVEILFFDRVKSVCANCLLVVEIINDFRASCQKAETLHRTKSMMMHPGGWMRDENVLALDSCHRLVKRNRAEMDALFRCSGLDSECIQRLPVREESVPERLPPEPEPVMAFERVDVPVKVEAVDIKTEETVETVEDKEAEMSVEQHPPQVDEAMEDNEQERSNEQCETEQRVVAEKGEAEQRKTQEVQKSNECPQCNRKFRTHVLMLVHVLNAHKWTKERFKCDTCHKSIEGKTLYEQHLLTHQPTKKLKVPCGVCGKMFYEHWVKDHMFVPSGEQSYQCQFCDRKFSALNGLAVHRRRKHQPYRKPETTCRTVTAGPI